MKKTPIIGVKLVKIEQNQEKKKQGKQKIG